MSQAHILSPLFLSLCVAVTGCDRSEGTAPSATSSPTAAAIGSTAPGVQPAAAAASGTCPVGRYEYDYADQFLESLTKNTPGARVVREKGKFVCTFPSAERGTYTCEATEGGVENVFEADTSGGRMEISIKLEGRSTTSYETAGPNRWKSTSADLSALKTETKAKMGAISIPMPSFKPFQGADTGSTTFEWKCEGDTLKLKPEVAGMATDWLHMKRLP